MDRDGDGVRDTADNCPQQANPEQYDEDADAVGDLCDNCPHVANLTQLDLGETTAGRMRDGVGDACDPNPSTSGDRLAMFLAFNKASDFKTTDATTWSTAGVENFAVTGGVLRNTSNANLALAWRNNYALHNATLVTKVKYTSVSSAYQFRGFALLGNFSRTGLSGNTLGLGLGCGEMRDVQVAQPFYNGAEYQGPNFSNQVNAGAAAVSPNQVAVYTVKLSDAGVSCSVPGKSWARSGSHAGTGVALSAWGVGVDIEYLAAYTVDAAL